MRAILTALTILIVLNLLAVGAGVAWLAGTDRLSRERVEAVVAVFKPTIAQEEAAAREAEALAAEAAQTQAEALRLAEVADGPKTLEARLAESRRVDEVTAQRVERLKREREDILRQIEAAKLMIERQREEIAVREQAFDQRVAAYQEQRESDDFKRAVSMLEQLKPGQVKQVLQDFMATGETEQAVAYLAAMNQRKAGAVLREFKEEPELEQARTLIEALRMQGVFPS